MSTESVARRFNALLPHLTERQRRLWLATEARELGTGGVAKVARTVGVAPSTVRRGLAELDHAEPPPVRVSRKPGGGRKRAETRDPELIHALEALMDPTAAPIPLRHCDGPASRRGCCPPRCSTPGTGSATSWYGGCSSRPATPCG